MSLFICKAGLPPLSVQLLRVVDVAATEQARIQAVEVAQSQVQQMPALNDGDPEAMETVTPELVYDEVLRDETHEEMLTRFNAIDGFVYDGDMPANPVFDFEQKIVSAAPPVITRSDVNAERDRRIEQGFNFTMTNKVNRAGGSYIMQAGLKSQTAVTSLVSRAKDAASIQGGSHGANDYRWLNPDEDFSYPSLDNTEIALDVDEMIELGRQLSVFVDHIMRRGRALKALEADDGIPANFTEDNYWN